MTTIINVSNVTDNSGETPIVTYSNEVTTIIRQTPPAPVIRVYCHIPCDCCNCCNCCNCHNCCNCRCCGCAPCLFFNSCF